MKIVGSFCVCVWMLVMAMKVAPGQEAKPMVVATTLREADPGFLGSEVDLGGKLPEEFDWQSFFQKSDGSTGSRMMYAVAAHKALKKRMDEISAAQRQLLVKQKDEAALALYDKMQDLWKQAADAEVAFVGSEYAGGSEAKVSYAAHRFQVYLRRVQELRVLGDTAHFGQ